MARVGWRRRRGSDPPVIELDPEESVEVTVYEPGEGPAEPVAPVVEAEEPPLSTGQLVRLVAVAVTIVLTGVIVFAAFRSATGPSIASLRRDAGWENLSVLKVGVNGDVPGLSDCTSETVCSGFDTDVARLIGDWLGVPRQNVQFYRVTPEDRPRMVGTTIGAGAPARVDVDLMIAGYSITPEREQQEHVVFAGPYLVTETTVLTSTKHAPVESLTDLARPVPDGKGGTRKQRVCVPGATTSAGYLDAAVESQAVVTPVLANSECVAAVRAGRQDAAVTDAAILAGFADRWPDQLRLNNITTSGDERWGVGIGVDPTGHDRRLQARKQLVLLALTDLYDQTGQESWQQAYQNDFAHLRTDGNAVPAPDQQPPQAVAQDLQPQPEVPATVYRWPWERNGAGTVGGT